MAEHEETNWGGNVRYRAKRIEQPTTLEQLQQLCAGAEQVSVLGSRHSFSGIGDGAVLVDLSRLERPAVVDADLVTVSGSSTYATLSAELHAAERALHNLASLPHISVAGAIATGTHGSGSTAGNLATAVEAVTIVTADGMPRTFSRGDTDFDGVVVGLGSLGVVTELVLRTEPTFEVAQTVYDGLGWDDLTTAFDSVFELATSVSVFTRWGEQPAETWLKRRVDAVPNASPADFGLRAAGAARHPIPGADGSSCTTQMGRPGPWWNRLPHFRADRAPSVGAEIQSEWFVDRADSAAAIDAMRGIGAQLDDVLLVSEIRTVAGDDFWMSPCSHRASTAFHFTWALDPEPVQRAVDLVGRTLQPFGARPHLGKVVPTVWTAHASGLRVDDFLELKRRLDPSGTFTTPWFEQAIDAGVH